MLRHVLEPGRLDEQRRMGLGCRREPLLNANVDLLLARSKPCASTDRQGRRLLDLGKTEDPCEESPRLVLAARRRGELNVIDAEDAHAWSNLTITC